MQSRAAAQARASISRAAKSTTTREITSPLKPKRRRFRFSLRSLLLAVSVLCLMLGWIGPKLIQVQRQRRAVEEILKHNGRVRYDYQSDEIARIWNYDRRPPVPGWLCDLLGDDFFGHVEYVSILSMTFADASPLADLPHLRYVFLRRTNVEDLSPLAGLRELKILELEANPISDLSPLANMPDLETLSIPWTKVEDITPLSGLKNLSKLQIGGTRVSDISVLSNLTELTELGLSKAPVADLTALKNLPKLSELEIHGTNVGDEQIAELRRARPEMFIYP